VTNLIPSLGAPADGDSTAYSTGWSGAMGDSPSQTLDFGRTRTATALNISGLLHDIRYVPSARD
jgi:hypothetical protein